MKITATTLPEVLELIPDRITDARGYFSETWNSKTLAEAGFDLTFCQDNESLSMSKGTLRGMHVQGPPAGQCKLVRVVAGAVMDVAVDIRKGSANFCKWVGVELSAEKGNQLLIPEGFLHGFLTLTPDTRVAYKCTAGYAPLHEFSIRWNDPAIGIDWGVRPAQVILSPKDRSAPCLSAVGTPFTYGVAA